ncbi:hypothetical protein PENTCL1PPCAC_29571, partial [Pristionchus entomophagus]
LLLIVAVAVRGDDPTWSAWTETPNSACSDNCGYCGVRVTSTRTCSELGKCSGIAQRYEECGPAMCKFPKKLVFNTCCAGYVKGLLPGGTFECTAKALLPVKTRLA